jgi:hypothetical protein
MSDMPEAGQQTAVLPRVTGIDTPAEPVPAPPPTPDTTPHPAEIPQERPETPEATAPPAGRHSAPHGPASAVRGSVLTSWLVAASRVCGEWVSLSITTPTRTAVINAADAASFTRWCGHLSISDTQRTHGSDALGTYAQGTTAAHGWTLTVHLIEPPREGTS